MVSVLIQFLTALSLIGGIIVGEAVATSIFGSNKKWYINIIELMLFILLLIVIMDKIYLPEANYFLILGINFFLGSTGILLSRGSTTGFGFLSQKIKLKLDERGKVSEQTLIIGLLRNLNGKLPAQELKRLLENSGFNKKKVDFALKNQLIDGIREESSQEPEGTKRNF